MIYPDGTLKGYAVVHSSSFMTQYGMDLASVECDRDSKHVLQGYIVEEGVGISRVGISPQKIAVE